MPMLFESIKSAIDEVLKGSLRPCLDISYVSNTSPQEDGFMHVSHEMVVFHDDAQTIEVREISEGSTAARSFYFHISRIHEIRVVRTPGLQ